MINKILLVVIILLMPISVYFFLLKDNAIQKSTELTIKLKENDKIKEYNLNDYLIGVVGSEMPASFNIEALKAQAIVARTFALYQQQTNGFVTISDQSYKTVEDLQKKWSTNFEKYYNIIQKAVLSTANYVITYNNNLIKSYYYSMSNGYTEDSNVVFKENLPYIAITDSKYDNENISSFLSTSEFEKIEFCNLIQTTCDNLYINNITKDDSNRVSTITINNQEIEGTIFRKILNLKSTDFQIEINEKVKITTKGYGHGVGMSQYGANGMALDGYNYSDIINHYYQNIEIVDLNV